MLTTCFTILIAMLIAAMTLGDGYHYHYDSFCDDDDGDLGYHYYHDDGDSEYRYHYDFVCDDDDGDCYDLCCDLYLHNT